LRRKPPENGREGNVTTPTTGSGEMKESTGAQTRPLLCPVCQEYELRPFGRTSARCEPCQIVICGPFLATLRRITELPDALGLHACECGHPEMRLLPDKVYRCPACGSEVLPIGAATRPAPENRSVAYWSGWLDGRYGDPVPFADNPSLNAWDSAADRLDYYRGHRSGRDEREGGVQPALPLRRAR